MNLLISACLCGLNCRYDGTGAAMPSLDKLIEKHSLIPVCPEQLGGLPTPRPPAERRSGGVFTKSGSDLSEYFLRGAEETLKLAELFSCPSALLKERSPSCGAGKIYDGSFSGSLTEGDGVCAALLKANGIEVLGESSVHLLL